VRKPLGIEERLGNPAGFPRTAGFTLIETLVSLGLMGVVIVSLYGAMNSGLETIVAARENILATQPASAEQEPKTMRMTSSLFTKYSKRLASPIRFTLFATAIKLSCI
jgi:prepilin-type N-terminal cleavage/methylation domain-containing protein